MEGREAARRARIEAARAAKEEEDRMLAGLDEVDALLMRQQLRQKVRFSPKKMMCFRTTSAVIDPLASRILEDGMGVRPGLCFPARLPPSLSDKCWIRVVSVSDLAGGAAPFGLTGRAPPMVRDGGVRVARVEWYRLVSKQRRGAGAVRG